MINFIKKLFTPLTPEERAKSEADAIKRKMEKSLKEAMAKKKEIEDQTVWQLGALIDEANDRSKYDYGINAADGAEERYNQLKNKMELINKIIDKCNYVLDEIAKSENNS